MSEFVMWAGFILSAYAVVGNDVIQTLGTFLTSNEKNMKWWVLWIFAASILCAALCWGYYQGNISYGRLDKFTNLVDQSYYWFYLIPPITLLFITRVGIPVSTTFMILTLFSLQDVPNDVQSMLFSLFDSNSKLGGMIQKSIFGYLLSFAFAGGVYLLIHRFTEKKFAQTPLQSNKRIYWIVAQWFTTGFLWFQWLTQDLANLYVFLEGGFTLNVFEFILSLVIICGLLAFIFYRKGGKIQNVIKEKTNCSDIRSATFIDLIYGIFLYLFKYNILGLYEGKIPMSTTWVFVGLLGGRELAIRILLKGKIKKKISRMIFADLGKVSFGLIISVALVFIIKLLVNQ